jgi:hypothetical protein
VLELQAVLPDLAADATVEGVRERVEAVEPRAHVDRVVAEALRARAGAVHEPVAAAVAVLAARGTPHEREVDRAAAAVAGLRGDVALLEQHALLDARVELRLHPLVARSFAHSTNTSTARCGR